MSNEVESGFKSVVHKRIFRGLNETGGIMQPA